MSKNAELLEKIAMRWPSANPSGASKRIEKTEES